MSNTVSNPASVVAKMDANGQPYAYQMEAELMSPAPRHARLTSGTRATRLFLWNLLLGTFCVLLFFARRDLASWDALLQRGVVTQAQIIQKYTSQSKNGLTYHIDYGFYAQQEYCYGEMSVSESYFTRTEVGNKIPVTYLPESNGEIWQAGEITQERRHARQNIWIASTIGAMGVLGIIITCSLANWNNQLYLLQNGVVVPGTITEIRPSRPNYPEHGYTVTYRYPVGKKRILQTIYLPQNAAEQYTQGNPFLTVLYHSVDPYKSLPYIQITAARLDSSGIS